MTVLDVNTKYETTYCIPLWLRDLQIKAALKRTDRRIQPREKHEGKIAIVGYGPSLNETWEQLKGFEGPTISCSGATRFLIDRGIVPAWHVEVDPRPHKVKLIGAPHPDVEYLIASTCHADVFELLKDSKVTLWHVFSNEEEAIRVLPRGEWAITGGCDVGMRCMTIARFFGFADMHIFGIDGSFGAAGNRHAAEHPHAQKAAPLEYEGRTFYTTQAMLESAKMVFHEMNQLIDVTPTFYGDGLVQEMAKHYKREPAKSSQIALNRPELISASYAALNRDLHESNLAYGVGGGKYAKVAMKLAASLFSSSILDYGCGKGMLAKEIPFPIWEYDPAVPGKETPPRPADLVISTDVLEHIEPEKILFVLDDLRRCTRKMGYLVIHTGPSGKTLPDGRNTHVLQRNAQWWAKMLGQFFVVAKIIQKGPLLHVVVVPGKMKKKEKAPVSVASQAVAS